MTERKVQNARDDMNGGSLQRPKKQSFTPSDLVGLDVLRRLLDRLYDGDDAKAESKYDAMVSVLLQYRYRATAQLMLNIELDVLTTLVGNDEQHAQHIEIKPLSDDAIDATLMNWVADVLRERFDR